MSFFQELAVIVALVMANGFFAGAEIALLAVRKTRLQELADEGAAGATAALRLRRHPERFLATVQVGITVVGATAAVFGGARLHTPIEKTLSQLGLGRASEEVAGALVVALVSTLSIVLGELVPKSLALRSGARFALLVARPVLALAWMARPVVWALTGISNLILRPFGDVTQFTEARLSPEELYQMLEEAGAAQTIEPTAAEVAQRSIDLAERSVNAVMIPRGAMVTLRQDAPIEEAFARMKESAHARYPVIGEGGEVVGYALARELYEARLADEADMVRLTRPAPYVPQSARVLAALRTMQRARSEMAMVVDESGATVGLVTVEDVVEELVGEVLDEDEQPGNEIVRESDTSFVVEGTVPVHELNRAMNIELPEDRAWGTIAGLVLARAGRIPKAGEKVTLEEGLVAEVLDATRRRVRRLRVHVVEPPKADDD